MKTLIVSQAVPPAARASTVIVANLATQFKGDQVVLAGERPYKKSGDDFSKLRSPVYHVGIALAKWVPRGRRLLQWILWLEFPLVLWRGIRIARRHKVQLIVTVFPNEYYLFLGYLIAKFTSTHFVPWYHNTYLENRTGLSRIIASWLQPKVFKRAPFVFVMSEGMVDFYREKYPNVDFKALTHSFDIPSLEEGEINHNINDKNCLSLAFAGTLNHTCYDATKSFHTALNGTDHYVNYYTKVPKSIFEKLGISGKNMVYKGLVPLQELGTRLSEADFCLITHGFTGGLSDAEYETIFPTRLVPLLYSGKPIIAHCPSSSFLAKFLIKHDCALVITEKDPYHIQLSLQNLANDSNRRKQLVSNAFRVCKMFTKQNVASHFRNCITNL